MRKICRNKIIGFACFSSLLGLNYINVASAEVSIVNEIQVRANSGANSKERNAKASAYVKNNVSGEKIFTEATVEASGKETKVFSKNKNVNAEESNLSKPNNKNLLDEIHKDKEKTIDSKGDAEIEQQQKISEEKGIINKTIKFFNKVIEYIGHLYEKK